MMEIKPVYTHVTEAAHLWRLSPTARGQASLQAVESAAAACEHLAQMSGGSPEVVSLALWLRHHRCY